MYEYKCTLDRVVDGDTVDVYIDLGFSVSIHQRVRLLGIDAPESRTRDLEEKARGIAATEYLEERLTNASEIIVKTELDKRGKFGRVLGLFFIEGKNINEEMISVGHAVIYGS